MDLNNLSFDMSGVWGAAAGFVDWVLILFYVFVAGVVVWGLLYLLSFKVLVRVRQATASGYVIVDTKAREYTTHDGVKKWRFLKLSWFKDTVVAPPISYIELTSKGKFSIEADRSVDGTIHWRKRSGEPDVGDVFTSEERLITANEMRRANEYKKAGMMQQVIQIMYIVAVVMVLVLVFAFYGDITNTGIHAIDKGTEAINKVSETCDALFAKIERCDCTVSNSSIKVNTGGVDVPPIPN